MRYSQKKIKKKTKKRNKYWKVFQKRRWSRLNQFKKNEAVKKKLNSDENSEAG